MKTLMTSLKYMLVFFVIAMLTTLVVIYYPWIFGKNVEGEIVEVERVTMPNAFIGQVNKFQMHSYAVLIQDKTGEMFTSSSEDRRWEVAKKGMCVVSLFYRHPPWRLNSAGAFYNARVKKIYRCPGKDYSKPSEEESSTEIENPSETP
jgi:hypothetical protein